MSNMFYNGFYSEGAMTELKSQDVFPLVREIIFKYALKVVRNTSRGWLLCHAANGIAVGKVSVRLNDEGKTEYCYSSPYFRKERGSSDEDRHTLRSIKVSSLMSSIKKMDAIPSAKDMEQRKTLLLSKPVTYMKRKLGDSSKNANINPDLLHALLANYFGENPNSRGLSIDDDICKNLFDKFNNADTLKAMKREKTTEFFTNPFYMIGIDEFGDYLIGKVQLTPPLDETKAYMMIEPFARYKNIEEGYPDLIPIMTMMRLVYENKEERKEPYAGMPYIDSYDEALNTVFFYEGRTTHYDHIYMVTPC
jgi:hypothetical protein